MRRPGTWVAALVFAAGAAGAHHQKEPPGFEPALSAADHAYDKRAYADALAGFRAAEGLATQPENQAYIQFRIGLTLRELGRFEEACATLRRLAAALSETTQAARALYTAAMIREERLSDPAGAERELRDLLRRYPKSDAAGRALRHVARRHAERDPNEAVEMLRGIYRAHRSGPLAPHAAYLAARIEEEMLKSPEEAIRLYELVVRRYPRSGYFDDSI